MKLLVLVAAVAVLCACSNPKDTVVPTSFDKMENIKPQLEKLTSEERDLFASYALRHTLGAAMKGMFGIKAEPIPEGITIGKAIDEQRDFLAKAKMKEAEEKALKEKIIKERELVQKQFDAVLTVAFIDKKPVKESFGLSQMNLTFGFENKGSKDIAGVKGESQFIDMFGDTISENNLTYDKTITAGKTATWTGQISSYSSGYRKLENAEPDKIKFKFIPEQIVFTDGTKLVMPKVND